MSARFAEAKPAHPILVAWTEHSSGIGVARMGARGATSDFGGSVVSVRYRCGGLGMVARGGCVLWGRTVRGLIDG